MPQGIICVNPISAFKDYFDLTIDPALINLGKLKEALLLPDRYTVERVHKPIYGPYRDSAEIIVSCLDIPEIAAGEALPTVTPCYLNENSEDFKTRTISLSDILINGVSAIKEEDKACKVNMGIKELAEESDDCAGSEALEVLQDPRDTQFAGFAKLLWDELEAAIRRDFNGGIPEGKTWRGKCIPAWQKIITRRFYDFAGHVMGIPQSASALEELVSFVPDLTEWPGNP
jgi:hypothetical protein